MTLHDESKKKFVTVGPMPTHEEINTGSLQRIADACELMAKDRLQMERDLKWANEDRDNLRRLNKRLKRRLAAAKGQITKLKNQIKAQS